MGFRVLKAFVYSHAGEYFSVGSTFYAKDPQRTKDAEALIEAGFLEAPEPKATKTAVKRAPAKK